MKNIKSKFLVFFFLIILVAILPNLLFAATDSFKFSPDKIVQTYADNIMPPPNLAVNFSNTNPSNSLKNVKAVANGDITKLGVKILAFGGDLPAGTQGTMTFNIMTNLGNAPGVYKGNLTFTAVVFNTNQKISGNLPIEITVPARSGITFKSFGVKGNVKLNNSFSIELVLLNGGNIETGNFTATINGLTSSMVLDPSTPQTISVSSLKKFKDSKTIVWKIKPNKKETAIVNVTINGGNLSTVKSSDILVQVK
jgi:hypothetical protein